MTKSTDNENGSSKTKEDKRTRYTKMFIKEGLIELLNTKAIDEITVTELCELAEINRSTFYLHYHNCYDIFDELRNDQVDEIDSRIPKDPEGYTIEKWFTELFILAKESPTSKIAWVTNHDPGFCDRLSIKALEYLRRQFEYFGVNEKDMELYGLFVLGGLSRVQRNWIENGFDEEPEVLAHRLIAFINNGLGIGTKLA